MTNPQGTEWETEWCQLAKDHALPAMRLVKQGVAGEPDTVIGNPHPDSVYDVIPVVAWKRLASKKPGQKKRRPDGERDVVIMRAEDFMYLIHMYTSVHGEAPTVMAQNKWTEKLNVTRTLDGLRKGIGEIYG